MLTTELRYLKRGTYLGQKAAKLSVVKVGGLKNSASRPELKPHAFGQGLSPGQLDHPQHLTDRNFAAL